MKADLLTELVPVLSASRSKPFSILSVLRHGTHEKQLSNFWAWVLDSEGSHGLGDAVQQIFVDEINRVGSLASPVPYGPYGVRQEQNTSEVGDVADIADIVLEDASTSIVIENYYTSDGHGHDYERYSRYGARGRRNSVVVLLCESEVRSRLTAGWDAAPVLVYSELLDRILDLVTTSSYGRRHPEQALFIANVHRHFTRRTAMENRELVAFVDALCRSGEALRYSAKDQNRQAVLLGDSLRDSAIERYAESREVLSKVKKRLRDYIADTLIASLNASLGEPRFTTIKFNWQGKWQYDVSLVGSDGSWLVSIAFGPTAAAQLQEGADLRLGELEPDFTRLLLYTKDRRACFSDVSIVEVLEGLDADDTRLRDEVLSLLREPVTDSAPRRLSHDEE